MFNDYTLIKLANARIRDLLSEARSLVANDNSLSGSRRGVPRAGSGTAARRCVEAAGAGR